MFKFLSHIFRRPSYYSDLTKSIEDFNEAEPNNYYDQVHGRRIYWYGETNQQWLENANKSVVPNKDLVPTSPKNL